MAGNKVDELESVLGLLLTEAMNIERSLFAIAVKGNPVNISLENFRMHLFSPLSLVKCHCQVQT
jgi:hypothetical protein